MTDGAGFARVELGIGVETTVVQLERNNDDLLIRLSATDTVRFAGVFGGDNVYREPAPDEVAFADGTRWDQGEIFSRVAGFGTRGTAGNDTLTGTMNNDALIGLAGNDSLNGGDGADVLIGGDGNDTLNGGLAVDAYWGGAGDDTYVLDAYEVEQVSVFERPGEGIDTIQTPLSIVIPANVENVTLISTAVSAQGNGLNNSIVGNASANELYGAAGNDTLNGGTGADRLFGGAGDDTYVVDNAGDVATEYTNEGADLLQSNVSFTLPAEVENLTLTGTSAINGTGNSLDNALTGNSAKNTLTGLAGNDTYYVGSGDTVTEAAGAGTDTVVSSVTWTLAANVEVLTLAGTAAINGTGNSLDNYLRGNIANNTLNGSGGNDVLQGLAGNDTVRDTSGKNALDGGDGTDTLTGGTASDFLAGGAGNDTLNLGGGADIVAFNRGHGADAINAPTTGAGLNETNDTLSLGGVRYADLRLARSGNDLYVKVAGTTDSVRFINWYAATGNRTTTTLQMVVDSTADYNGASTDQLVNRRVVRLNFTTLVNAFNTVYSGNSSIGDWAIPTATLNSAFIAGADTQALGGDLAYRYGRDGNLSALDYATAVGVLGDANFATAAQTFSAGPTTGGVRLLGVGTANTATAQSASSVVETATTADASIEAQRSTKRIPSEIQRYADEWFAGVSATTDRVTYLTQQALAAAADIGEAGHSASTTPLLDMDASADATYVSETEAVQSRWRAVDAAIALLERHAAPVLGGEAFEAGPTLTDTLATSSLLTSTAARPRQPVVRSAAL